MDKIKGINCEVKNCIYHNTDNCCTAGHIRVGSSHATKTADTKCETFECSNAKDNGATC